MTVVGIIDYGMGNVSSVLNAFNAIGASARVVGNASELAAVTHVVLPGVGSFPDAMRRLNSGRWIPAMEQAVLDRSTPFLGICLGLQLLGTTSSEFGITRGLGWISGSVIRLEPKDRFCRIPHIGWNEVAVDPGSSMYADTFRDPAIVYFVHSYHLLPDDPSVVNGWCDHGGRFAASISSGNIWAVQYHPEKSQRAGLQILRNFVAEGVSSQVVSP
jgi:imidazole glycerol-phosphate synthase subunit HisH